MADKLTKPKVPTDAEILEAETGLITAILADPDGDLTRRLDGFTSAFTNPECAAIFKAADSMVREGRTLEDVFEIGKRAGISHGSVLAYGQLSLSAADAAFETNRRICYEAMLRRTQASLAERLRETDLSDREAFDKLIAEIGRIAQALTTGTAKGGILTEMEPRRATMGRVVIKPVPVLVLGGTVVTTRGSISMATAQKKSGKTAMITAAAGAIIGGPDASGDTFTFTSHNPEGHAVLHLDTEQSVSDHDASFRIMAARAGVKEPPPWFYSYCVTGMSVTDLWRVLNGLVFALKEIHGGVFCVMIDGIGDLVADPNDPEESNRTVARLYELAVRFDCSVLGVLHLNPASKDNLSKSRGHLGSQMERKVEVDLRVVKDAEEVSRIFTACARHKPINEGDGPCFKWDNDTGMHMSTAASVPPELLDAAREAFKGETLLGHNELERKIIGFKGGSESTAKRLIKKMIGFKVIEKASGCYRQRRTA